MQEECVIRDERDGVSTLTLNRPQAANSIDLAMALRLADLLLEIELARTSRVILLTGSGRFFSAGGDLAAFASGAVSLSHSLRQVTSPLHTAISRIVRLPLPVIALVNGPAAGAGLGLAAACDLVIASEAASFTSAYTAAGLTPDGSCTWTVPRRIGRGRALELFLTNRKLSAADALDWGLVNEVVPAERLAERGSELAAALAAGPAGAFGGVKALMAETDTRCLEGQMEAEAIMISDMARTADAEEGVAAFLGKRKANFGSM